MCYINKVDIDITVILTVEVTLQNRPRASMHSKWFKNSLKFILGIMNRHLWPFFQFGFSTLTEPFMTHHPLAGIWKVNDYNVISLNVTLSAFVLSLSTFSFLSVMFPLHDCPPLPPQINTWWKATVLIIRESCFSSPCVHKVFKKLTK